MSKVTQKQISMGVFFTLCRKAMSRRAVIIFAPYWDDTRMDDGYFRRVMVSDSLMRSVQKIYFDFPSKPKMLSVVFASADRTFLRFGANRMLNYFMAGVLMLLSRRVYCESIWQTKKAVLALRPLVKTYIDVHGSVPEEEFLYGRYDDAQKYGGIEEMAVEKAEHLFCVSGAMIRHFGRKYGDRYIAKSSVLPIFDERLMGDKKREYKKVLAGEKPIIIYAGGVFKWQKIELMQMAIKDRLDMARYRIYTPTPDKFWDIWDGKRPKNLIVDSKTPQELSEKCYPKSHYGFVLRDDIVVNNVSCPTKIAEYLRFGIVPIVNTPNIGDYKDLGMKYLALEDFLRGRLYSEDERQKIVEHNYRCLEEYKKRYYDGVLEFKKIMLEGGE